MTASSAPESTSPASNAAPAPKKNKYPCPYAQTHKCTATFTTSGHAARHGKKHTGEKGVHCPVCNKAFTRKDNMKQHERTHKNASSGNNPEEVASRRSKAALTREAQKTKDHPRKSESIGSEPATHSAGSKLQSPLSDVTSIAPSLEAPMSLEDQAAFFPVTTETPLLPMNMPILPIPENVSPNSHYPPIGTEDMLLPMAAVIPPLSATKMTDINSMPVMPMPTLIRGFSDLDTLAQAAETFDPYYQPNM
jgi:uncharacterized Zn finger protein (UPF0148 family)